MVSCFLALVSRIWVYVLGWHIVRLEIIGQSNQARSIVNLIDHAERKAL
jgi:hypothetical protein